MVEIIRSGMSALPAVESVNHMVTAANTMPASTPSTAPRSSLEARGSARRLVVIATAIRSPRTFRFVVCRRGGGALAQRSAAPVRPPGADPTNILWE
jgi:hypothetical protein